MMPPMSFGQISKALAVPANATATYTFFRIQLCKDGSPKLTCTHAGDGTLAFKRASWHAANVNRKARPDNTVTETKTKAKLLEEAKMIADHCVVSWEHVIEDDGKVAPCTPDKVLEFLTAVISSDEGLTEYVAFREWVTAADTFRPGAAGDEVELGKT